jgi:hypothetical protein
MRYAVIFSLLFSLAALGACDKKKAEGPAQAEGVKATPEKVATASKKAETTTTPAATTSVSTEAKVPGCLYEDDKTQAGECPHEDPTPAKASDTKVAKGHFGAPFVLKTSQPLSKAIATAEADKDKLQQLSGTIGEVCKKKGCWFVLQDGTQQARVMMRDPKYFVIPIKSSGKKARLEGRLITKIFTEANVKHIEHDAGRDPSKVSGTRKEFVIMARAVEIDG